MVTIIIQNVQQFPDDISIYGLSKKNNYNQKQVKTSHAIADT